MYYKIKLVVKNVAAHEEQYQKLHSVIANVTMSGNDFQVMICSIDRQDLRDSI